MDEYNNNGKRSHGYEHSEERQKRRNSGKDYETSGTIETVYRILCPIPKVGAIIGKGGSTIRSIINESHAKVKVEDTVPGAEERVVYISSTSRDAATNGFVSPAQQALFKVYSKIIFDDDNRPVLDKATIRLLVPSCQIGCLLGKGGHIIEKMRKEIPCQIRVLPKDQVPRCATVNDDLVQLSGDPDAVERALSVISSRLHENPPREHGQAPLLPPLEPMYPPLAGGGYMPYAPFGYGPSYAPPYGGGFRPPPMSTRSEYPSDGGSIEEEFSLRVLCPNDKIGIIIGKGGSGIRKIREDTGAKIKVGDPIMGSEDGVIRVSSIEAPEDPVSPAMDAAMLLQKRLVHLILEKDTKALAMIKLLVLKKDVGCLLGKGGSVISEMRKFSGANIRIIKKEEASPCAEENDEMVQITGDQNAVLDAFFQVISRLRLNFFKIRD